MRMGKLTILVAALALFFSYAPASADWVDDWMGDVTANYTGPGYFEGQKRGYASFGSFSARQLMTRDRLATFTPPRVRFGCGGIDVFLGGFSYMNFDYLVEKFQNIISAAPAFAFEYALRSVCAQCGSIIDSLEGISNLLNQMQLDDCALSKELGYWAAAFGDDQYKAAGDRLGTAMARFKQESGLDDLWKHVQDDFMARPDPGATTPEENEQVNEDCPQYLNELVARESLVRFVYDTYFAAFDASFEDLLRGFLGDVVFEERENHLRVHVLPPCGGANKDSFVAFVDGTAQVNPGHVGIDSCELYSGTRLRDLVETTLEGVYTKLETRTALDPGEEALLKLIPLPVYEHIRQCYVYDAPLDVVRMLNDPAAYGLGYALLTSVYSEVIKTIRFIEENKVKACKAEMGGEKHCYICDEDESIVSGLKEFKGIVWGRIDEANGKWSQVQSDLHKAAQILDVLRSLSNEAIRVQLAVGRRE